MTKRKEAGTIGRVKAPLQSEGDEATAEFFLNCQQRAIEAAFDPEGVLGLKVIGGRWVDGEMQLFDEVIPAFLLRHYELIDERDLIGAFIHKLVEEKVLDIVGIVAEGWFVTRSRENYNPNVTPSKEPDRRELIMSFVETANGQWSRHLEIVRDEKGARLVRLEGFEHAALMGVLAGFWAKSGVIH